MAGKKKTGRRAIDELADYNYDAAQDRDKKDTDNDDWESNTGGKYGAEEGYDEDKNDNDGPKWTKNEFHLMETCKRSNKKSENLK